MEFDAGLLDRHQNDVGSTVGRWEPGNSKPGDETVIINDAGFNDRVDETFEAVVDVTGCIWSLDAENSQDVSSDGAHVLQSD